MSLWDHEQLWPVQWWLQLEWDGGFQLKGSEREEQINGAVNGLNCAAMIYPKGSVIYFASDSGELVTHILTELFYAKDGSPVRVVALQHEKEPLHLDTS